VSKIPSEGSVVDFGDGELSVETEAAPSKMRAQDAKRMRGLIMMFWAFGG
jgi:hypothetical protein